MLKKIYLIKPKYEHASRNIRVVTQRFSHIKVAFFIKRYRSNKIFSRYIDTRTTAANHELHK